MEGRKLIKSATVLSLDAKVGNLVDCDILVEGAKITAVARDIVSPDAEVIDAAGLIAMPGFVDSHRHMWKGVLRNAGTQFLSNGKDFGEKYQDKLAAAFRPEDIYASTLSSAAGAIDAGITTVLNHANTSGSKEHIAADLQATVESGIRSVFAFSPAAKTVKQIEDLSNLLDSSQELTRFALASADPDHASLEQLKADWGLAREMGIRISVQGGMGGIKRKDVLSALNKANLLGPDVSYAHGNTFTDKELRLIKDSGGAVVIAPTAEMMFGYGPPTIQRFLDAGLQPALGVDSEITGRGDLFWQMRAVISMQHAMAFDKRLARRMAPGQINTRDVIEYATANGAAALGLSDEIGTLTPGKEADIVLMREHHINVMPVNDPIGAVVWAMDTSNVDTVMVGGRILKRGGALLGFELSRLQDLAGKARQHVLKAA